MILTALLASLAVLLPVAFLFLYLTAPSPRKPVASERTFYNAVKEEVESFGGQNAKDDNTQGQVVLSVVIPAYNEETRILKMLQECVEYLEKRRKGKRRATSHKSVEGDGEFAYEIIVVDDGSRDKTARVVYAFHRAHPHVDIKVMRLVKNRGKGGAVTQGMLVARGKYVMFADADGASKFEDFEKLEEELLDIITFEGHAVVVGSRAHLVGTEAVVKRSFIRNFLMHTFHLILHVLGIRSIRDTQCGFKLFSALSAQQIFPNIHCEGWIFDIEVLLLAMYQDIPVSEVQITWTEVEGSKVSLIKDSIRMLKDLIVIRLCYALRIWRIKDQNEAEANGNGVGVNGKRKTKKTVAKKDR